MASFARTLKKDMRYLPTKDIHYLPTKDSCRWGTTLLAISDLAKAHNTHPRRPRLLRREVYLVVLRVVVRKARQTKLITGSSGVPRRQAPTTS